jgi:hypothetical protein
VSGWVSGPESGQVSGPVSTAQMDPGFQRCGQPRVAGHHQHKTARPADPRQVPPEVRSCRVMIVAQHDPCLAPRQTGNRGARIGQAEVIGEQPKAGQGIRLAAQTPGEEFPVHQGQTLMPTGFNTDTPAAFPASSWPDMIRPSVREYIIDKYHLQKCNGCPEQVRA